MEIECKSLNSLLRAIVVGNRKDTKPLLNLRQQTSYFDSELCLNNRTWIIRT